MPGGAGWFCSTKSHVSAGGRGRNPRSPAVVPRGRVLGGLASFVSVPRKQQPLPTVPAGILVSCVSQPERGGQ